MINETTYQTAYVPVSAWIVYQLQCESDEPKADLLQRRDAPKYYLEEQGMYQGADGSYQLTAATPLTQEKVQAVAQVVAESNRTSRRFKGIIPTNVVGMSNSPEVVVWRVKAARRKVNFSLKGLSSGEVPCPNLLFKVVDNNALIVYATKSYRVNEQTKLYRAPFPNIYQGAVCLGSARSWIREPATYEALMQQWEEIFFESTFNSDSATSRAKVSMTKLWNPLVDSKHPFPTKQLMDTHLTLSDLLP